MTQSEIQLLIEKVREVVREELDSDRDQIMTAKEMAIHLRIGKVNGAQTLCRMARKGEIPGKPVGKGYRFSRKAVEAAIQKGMRKP